MNQYEEAIKQLESRYKELERQHRPVNAWKILNEYVKPAIPFVGKHYFKQPKGQRVLVYASAENLTWLDPNVENDYYCSFEAMHRSRKNFEGDSFYPNVHIQPINDGGLLIATNRVMRFFFQKEYDEYPREFIERISCANYGKFTIMDSDDGNMSDEKNRKKRKNIDYASNPKLLDFSKEYVKADLEILKPDYIIMPKTMYFKGKQELFLKSTAPNATIVKIMQINNGNVNRHINRMELPECQLTAMEEVWKEQVHGYKKENFLKVYPYIDQVCENECK